MSLIIIHFIYVFYADLFVRVAIGIPYLLIGAVLIVVPVKKILILPDWTWINESKHSLSAGTIKKQNIYT